MHLTCWRVLILETHIRTCQTSPPSCRACTYRRRTLHIRRLCSTAPCSKTPHGTVVLFVRPDRASSRSMTRVRELRRSDTAVCERELRDPSSCKEPTPPIQQMTRTAQRSRGFMRCRYEGSGKAARVGRNLRCAASLSTQHAVATRLAGCRLVVPDHESFPHLLRSRRVEVVVACRVGAGPAQDGPIAPGVARHERSHVIHLPMRDQPAVVALVV